MNYTQYTMPNAQCPILRLLYETLRERSVQVPNAQHHKFQLNSYGKDFMNRCDVSVYIVPFDSLILTLWFFFLKRYP
ncbi:MAG: hypothetical protein HWQ38_32920 [Nostoc sp. NMS7]|uniref:hypothetical protein n=1 Tax=unclassified Nostoc TaxID=2593658 RepID=UPI0025D5B710|nr:hypothetical protein [Nostoc sp. NMS7]MBN3951018.1 hypothetical protein [Nostoc sp. NMS7]